MNTDLIINLSSVIAELRDEIKCLKSISKRTILPKYTSDQRDALIGEEGLAIYNTTTGAAQIYINGSWTNL